MSDRIILDIPESLLASVTPETPLAERSRLLWESSTKFEARNDENSMLVQGIIGRDVTLPYVMAVLRNAGSRGSVRLDVNSPGGSLFEGAAIYNALARHDGEITAHVLGQASSSAQLICMACDRVLMGEGSMQMIHNAQGVGIGDRQVMEKLADTMMKVDQQMGEIIAKRAKRDYQTVRGWMNEETFFDREEAVANGIADGYIDSQGALNAQAVTPVEATARAETSYANQEQLTALLAGLNQVRQTLSEVSHGNRTWN